MKRFLATLEMNTDVRKSEISATDVRKSEISATDCGNRRFLLRIGEIGDFCYGWGKSEIADTDGGNRRLLIRMGEIGDFCYGCEEIGDFCYLKLQRSKI
ncbi:MAG: hypothetical protein FWG98_09350 [Candidatus Cloacimonetes bacterium]|nr:hypothetical protein [Candidatus Cloacimonadota bacterium]